MYPRPNSYPNPNPSTTKEARISHWKNATLNKCCKVISNKMYTGDYSFEIHGYNPLPCKVFVGSFGILAEWLKANGWEHDKARADIIILTQSI